MEKTASLGMIKQTELGEGRGGGGVQGSSEGGGGRGRPKRPRDGHRHTRSHTHLIGVDKARYKIILANRQPS